MRRVRENLVKLILPALVDDVVSRQDRVIIVRGEQEVAVLLSYTEFLELLTQVGAEHGDQ